MCGIDVSELDELTTSALAELCNMISGQAAVNLEEIGKKVTITPPAILVGDKMQVYVRPPILCVPFSSNGAEFEINCAFP